MNFEPTKWSCSFCGTRGSADTRFAGGLGALMCTRLPRLLQHGLRRAGELGRRFIGWHVDDLQNGELLARLPLISATDAQVDRHLRDSVGQIRARHISYAEIGKALGVSRQAAWERFSRVVEDDDEVVDDAS